MTSRWLVAAVVLALAGGCSTDKPKATPTPSSSAAPSSSPVVAPSATPSPTPTPSPSPSASVATTPFCTTAQLRLSIGSEEGGAGQVHQKLVLTNRGDACSLHGYPGVSFLDAAGRQVGDPAGMNKATVRRVQLAPGGIAVALLTYSNAGAYPEERCRPKQASRVRVYPPGQRAALTAADAVLVCSASGAAQLHIDPVTPG